MIDIIYEESLKFNSYTAAEYSNIDITRAGSKLFTILANFVF